MSVVDTIAPEISLITNTDTESSDTDTGSDSDDNTGDNTGDSSNGGYIALNSSQVIDGAVSQDLDWASYVDIKDATSVTVSGNLVKIDDAQKITPDILASMSASVTEIEKEETPETSPKDETSDTKNDTETSTETDTPDTDTTGETAEETNMVVGDLVGDLVGDGFYALTLTATDEGGNTAEVTTLAVVDTLAPTITVGGDAETTSITVDEGTSDDAIKGMISVDDNFTSVENIGLEVTIADGKANVAATDSLGNKAEKSYDVVTRKVESSSSNKSNGKSSNSSGSKNGGSSSGSTSSGSSSNGSSSGGSASNGAETSSKTITMPEGDVVTLVSIASNGDITVIDELGCQITYNPNAWKYDTRYAKKTAGGFWADGTHITMEELSTINENTNPDANAYLLAR